MCPEVSSSLLAFCSSFACEHACQSFISETDGNPRCHSEWCRAQKVDSEFHVSGWEEFNADCLVGVNVGEHSFGLST